MSTCIHEGSMCVVVLWAACYSAHVETSLIGAGSIPFLIFITLISHFHVFQCHVTFCGCECATCHNMGKLWSGECHVSQCEPHKNLWASIKAGQLHFNKQHLIAIPKCCHFTTTTLVVSSLPASSYNPTVFIISRRVHCTQQLITTCCFTICF